MKHCATKSVEPITQRLQTAGKKTNKPGLDISRMPSFVKARVGHRPQDVRINTDARAASQLQPSSGQPQAPVVQGFMEPRFGRDQTTFAGQRRVLVPQTGAPALQREPDKLSVSQPEDALEQGADRPVEGAAEPVSSSGAAAPGSSQLLHSVQAKLEVSDPGDALELEADRAADQVMRMTSASPAAASLTRGFSARVDRAAAD